MPGGIAGEDVETGAAELARNYLARFGPATLADIQWWAGWTAGITKRALAAIDAVEVDLDDGVGWVLPDDIDDEAAPPWIAFLPALDSTTMGWKERAWYLGDLAKFGGPVFDVNGNAGPTIWVDGRVVGGWAQRKSGEIAYQLLTDVPREAAEGDRSRSRSRARTDRRRSGQRSIPGADAEGTAGMSHCAPRHLGGSGVMS